MQDMDGAENRHLYVVDLANGNTRDLTPFDGVQTQLSEKAGFAHAELNALLAAKPLLGRKF
jgi:hypothetical protein